MENIKRKRWSSEEKKQILERAIEIGVTGAAREFGMSTTTIKNWRSPERAKEKQIKQRSCPIQKQRNRERALKCYWEDREKAYEASKQSRKRRRFKRLVEMSNRFFSREEWLTAFDLWKIAKKQKLLCALTGEKLTNETISVDHIIPKSQNGSNRPENIRLVDKDVNLARRALTDEQFLLLCKKVVRHSTHDLDL